MSRASNILRSEDIKIHGKISLKMSSGSGFIDISDTLIKEKEDIEKKICEAKEEYEKIIIEIEKQREEIINEANEKAKDIEKRAYSLGYEQGIKNGYEDGFKESYEQNIEKAISESEKIKADGYSTLLDIRNKTKEYIKQSKEEILEISISIAEQVLRQRFEDKESMNSLLEKIIQEYSLKNDLIIKVNQIYAEELQESMKNMLDSLKLEQRIFVIGDSSIDKGNAEIETDNGKLIVGLESVLDKVKSELL